MKIKISPSVLAADFSKLGEEVSSVTDARADMLHLDVMDGRFVTNISFGIPVIESLRKVSDMFFDVHLMIVEPQRYIERFAEAGADLISFHMEATSNVRECLDLIHKSGKKAAIAIKPNTPADAVFPHLNDVDMVLVMTVEPGYGGQALIPETLEKVSLIRRKADEIGLDLDIEVDGGINMKTAKDAVRAGANVLVAGSAVFRADNKRLIIQTLRQS